MIFVYEMRRRRERERGDRWNLEVGSWVSGGGGAVGEFGALLLAAYLWRCHVTRGERGRDHAHCGDPKEGHEVVPLDWRKQQAYDVRLFWQFDKIRPKICTHLYFIILPECTS